MELLRDCPGCGPRFHVKLEGKKIVSLERHDVETPRVVRGSVGGPILVGGGGPVIVNIEEFQYNYKCKHCGHEWSEKRVEEQTGV
jgi:DNA-directed RNA polymerase subunit RPC12/RpoP